MARPREKPPAIVAELGRPETPEETAARKAENSRKHRANQTVINLVLALFASLAIVLFLVLVVVPQQQPERGPVDYRSVAERAETGLATSLVAPVLPPGWTANRAQLERAAGGGLTWYVGFLTPGGEFIALEQGIGSEQGIGLDSAWLASYLGTAPPTGTNEIEGVEWHVFDQRDREISDNFAYSLYAPFDETQYLLHGSANEDEFGILASAIAAELPDEKR